MMVPQPVGAGSERGFYIFFDPKTWQRERVSSLPVCFCYAPYYTSIGLTSI
jgi:hypothetical protein